MPATTRRDMLAFAFAALTPPRGLVGLVALLVGLFGAPAYAQRATCMAVFGQLASLVGEWRGVGDNAGISVTYTLVADGATLVEEFRPSHGSAMMTMFSVDGDHLLATHYCSAGNQPQMTTRALTRSPVRSLEFSLARITGMKTAGDWHNTRLEVFFEDENHFMQRWTYLDQGKAGTRVFHFERQ